VIDPVASGLSVRELGVRFGGAVAVDDLDLEAPRDRITGLIGPNGAGKTTTFNACSGLLRPDDGRVFLDGQDVTGLSASARARRGLGRTFQRMELFTSLTVSENVALGHEAAIAGSSVLRQVIGRSRERDEVAAAAAEAIVLAGIEHLEGLTAGDLSTGQRRLVELARVLAGRFTVLLLDEPSSGLDRDETSAFGDVLRRVLDARETGILLVEHDMSLLMNGCDYVYVLDFGKLIFEGTPSEVARSEVVQQAYLGTEIAS